MKEVPSSSISTRWTRWKNKPQPSIHMGLPGGSDNRESACNAGELGSIPGSGRSPGEGNGNPLQYSCLENPMDAGAWWAIVHGVAKSRTRLSNFTFTFHFHALEKEMATHSSVLAWRIPGMGEPGGLPSLGSHRLMRLSSSSSSSSSIIYYSSLILGYSNSSQ